MVEVPGPTCYLQSEIGSMPVTVGMDSMAICHAWDALKNIAKSREQLTMELGSLQKQVEEMVYARMTTKQHSVWLKYLAIKDLLDIEPMKLFDSYPSGHLPVTSVSKCTIPHSDW